LVIGEIIGLSRFVNDLLVNLGYMNHPIMIAYSSINFLHFAILLFLTCSTILFLINFAVNRKTIGNMRYLDYSLKESILEIPSFKKISSSRTSFIMSGFILLIIIGVWSLWS
jgi:SSS family solute:Na+ symporter